MKKPGSRVNMKVSTKRGDKPKKVKTFDRFGSRRDPLDRAGGWGKRRPS